MAEQTAAVWAERVRAWRSSGESAARFAAAHGLAESTLRWWARQLRAADTTPVVARRGGRAPRASAAVSTAPTKSVMLARVVRPDRDAAAAGNAGAAVEVLVGDVRVRVDRGVDETALRLVFRALGVGR